MALYNYFDETEHFCNYERSADQIDIAFWNITDKKKLFTFSYGQIQHNYMCDDLGNQYIIKDKFKIGRWDYIVHILLDNKN